MEHQQISSQNNNELKHSKTSLNLHHQPFSLQSSSETGGATTRQHQNLLYNFEQRVGNTKWQKIEDIREALEAKGKITDDEFQSLRFLVKEVIGYRDFSNQLRNELVSYITLQTFSQGELII
ncbi:hypothetical protein FGO68_gene3761 [Halteria grandinella]|uniref:Uncharacterized protein n=1 Tax=Halteria grandinella TaxID=5974 RepID=A0A8J8SXQ9_HALGN|nr:hypothetical protein FGO68_gene3761 [Halteria grandinella]